MTRNVATTWADGFGRWHAKVTFPSPGYGPSYLDGHIKAIRKVAREAIKREIAARSTPFAMQGYRLKIEVVDNDLNSMNQMRSITYAEKG